MTQAKLDPITLEMFWRRLNSTVDELAATLKRTSFSTVVRDVNDYATAIFDRETRLLAQSPDSTPGLCGPLGHMLRCMLRDNHPDTLVDGDVLIGNNPWDGSGHHNDITVTTPVFFEGALIGYTVSCCHHVDIGGRRATTESRDNYEEGLRIPHLKIFKAGELNTDVLAFIENNVRSAGTVIGDLRAQFAANHVGCERMKAVCVERGWRDLQELADEIIERSEALARAEVAKLPDGVYRHKAIIDIENGEEVTIRCQVTIAGEAIEIDYGGSSPQVKSAVNCTLTYASSYTTFAVNAALDLSIKINEGTLRVLKIKADEGTVVNCTFPAPTFARTAIGNHLVEIIYCALADAMPDRIVSGSGSTPMWGQYLFGKKQDGTPFAPLNCINGGMGARPDSDGVSCLTFPVNVGNTPVEVLESEVPILVTKRALWKDSAGPGEFRGGFGQEFEVEVLGGNLGPLDDILVSFRGGRFIHPVPGVQGGSGAPNGELYVNGERQEPGVQRTLGPGDRFLCRAPGGGGFGKPSKRSEAAIRQDLRAGLVSEDYVRTHYGEMSADDAGDD
jgi:N-methylhydantoinase B